MKQAFTDVIGNRGLCKKFFDDITQNKLSHAYILEGASGTGKHTVALRVAAALACENRERDGIPLPCMQCASCRKILSGNSPDVIYVNRKDKATLGVEVIRELKTDVFIAPNDLDAKIYLIEDAHLMTSQAQNAFLLTLEEPPAYVLFLLLCESAAPLLETIRSRAPVLRTEPLDTDQMREHLLRTREEATTLAQSNPRELEEILASANGSMGRAIALLHASTRKPILARREQAREFITLISDRRNRHRLMRFLTLASQQKREELVTLTKVLLLCLRDLLLCKQTEQAPLCFFADREEALNLAYTFTTPELLRLCDRVTEACDRLQKNANVRLTLLSLAVGAGLLQ